MPKRSAFITGIAGFAGSWLAEELCRHGYRVYGSLYEDEPTNNLDSCKNDVELFPMDVTDPRQVGNVLTKVRPDYVFHLAALAAVGKSFDTERLTYRVNFEGTLNVLEASAAHKKLKKLVFVSSSDAYGVFKPKNKTLTEDEPLNPVSPYGISKAAAEHLCRSYFRRTRVPVAVARSFNHAGPRQAENFVIPDFARQVAAIELGRQKPIMKTGNLTPRRDFSDVRDIVRGYRRLAEKGKPGSVYQFCSGRATEVRRVLQTLTGFASNPIRVTTDPQKKRSVEIPVIRGSNSRAVKDLGYEVRYTLRQTLRETYDYWLEQLGNE